jgi:hypothetical protein
MKGNDTGVILIYDTRGTIAGVQIAVSDYDILFLCILFYLFLL